MDAPRQGNEQFQKLDMADYSRKVFSMFGGEEEMVRLRFENRLVGVVMDRFGKDVTVFPKEDGFFEIYTRVVLSLSLIHILHLTEPISEEEREPEDDPV